MSKRCYGCMKIKEVSPICEHCGYNENVPNYPNQLPVGTVLRGKYTVGKVLGQGGFGITYLGRDDSLDATVAIKEFYPSGLVNRDSNYTQEVSCNGENAESFFRMRKERFMQEARILAKLQRLPGIVRVLNLFDENNTVYIVMEYVQGIDLKHYMHRINRPLTVKETLFILRPVIHAMHQVHKADIVHRDIAPDNIMILPDGSAKLLDFGAAREVENPQADQEMAKSTEAVLKQGFAPMEQYSRRGSLGPWTDVYAMCATIYYCMTGKLPNPSPERIMGDDNINWREIPGLTPQQIQVLEQGMALNPENRLRSMEDLYRGLYTQQAPEPKAPQEKEKTTPVPPTAPVSTSSAPVPLTAPVSRSAAPAQSKKKSTKVTSAVAALLAVIAVAAGLFLLKPKEEAPAVSATETTPAIAETTEPVATISPEDQKRYEEAVALEESGKKAEAAMAFGALGDVLDARQRSFDLWAEVTDRKTIAAGCDYTAAVKKDGTVVFDGWMDEDWQGIEQWENIIALSASLNHLVGLKDDGTVVAAGRNQDGQCDVSQWRDIVAIACGESHTVGLKSDGTVVTVGNNIYYERNLHRLDVERWDGIVAISADNFNTVGIRTDGTVIVTGYFGNWEQKTVIDWTDIVGISAGNWHVAGVKSDGTAVAGGDDAYQRCNVGSWTDIVAVSTGYFHTLGLKSDGTVVAVGRNTDNFAKPCGQCNVKEWKNVVDIDAGWYHSVALCADGTVQVTGRELTRKKTWMEWTDLLLPGEKLQKEEPEEITIPMAGADEAYAEAEHLLANGETAKAAIAFGKLAGYRDARERSFAIWETITYRETFPINWTKQLNSWYRTFVALKTDGTVHVGVPALQEELSQWGQIVALECGNYPSTDYVVGLKEDGSVVTAVSNHVFTLDTSQWSDVVEIDAKGETVVGLKADGTVVAVGSDTYGQCNVKDWTDIVSVCTNGETVVGIKADRTVIACGKGATKISGWTDIASISASGSIIGIKTDGTVVATSADDAGQWDLSGWTDIVAVDTAQQGVHIVGLRADGTVVAVGDNNQSKQLEVSDWTDIVEVYTTDRYTIGLKSDGTVVYTGMDVDDCLDVKDWKDIAAIRVMFATTIGLKKDGTVVFAGRATKDLLSWDNIRLPGEKLQKEEPGSAVDAGAAYAEAERMEKAGDYAKAAIAFGKLSGYQDARERSLKLWEKVPYPRDTLSASDWSILAITENGKIRSNNDGGLREKSEWSDVVAVSMGGNAHALGLKLDGTVESVTNELYTTEEGYYYPVDVSEWSDIVSIAAGPRHAVGLKVDGTVVATGKNDEYYSGQCDVADWEDIVAVCTGGYFTVGLKSNGEVLIVGDTAYQSSLSDACYWTNITAISAGEDYIVGLKSDGTVVSAGRDTFGETKVSNWTDIIKICAGDYHTLGLKADGTVISVGRNAEKQRNVSTWEDIVAIAAGYGFSLGLKSDGTIAVSGSNANQLSSWTDIRVP